MWKIFQSRKAPGSPASGQKSDKTPSVSTASVTQPKRVSPVRRTSASWSVVVAPLVSEKSTRLAQERKVVLLVKRTSTKRQIRRAFEELYGVAPTAVNVMINPEIRRRSGRKVIEHQGAKKAILTLPEGSMVDVTQPPTV